MREVAVGRIRAERCCYGISFQKLLSHNLIGVSGSGERLNLQFGKYRHPSRRDQV